MPRLMTRDGRIPKNKWLVVHATAPSRIISRHRYKSAAMDRALTMAARTGHIYCVAEIGVTSLGEDAFFRVWDTRGAFRK